MTIPYLTHWSPQDLTFLRTAIEEDAVKCERCEGSGKTPTIRDPATSIRCIKCHGTGTTHGHMTGIACDWLLEKLGRVQTCVHCCGTSSVVDPAIPITENWGDPLVTCPHCNGTGGERLPQWGVDSQMTEVGLLYGQGVSDEGSGKVDTAVTHTSSVGSMAHLGVLPAATRMLLVIPRAWFLWLAERLAPPSPCNLCNGTGRYDNEKVARSTDSDTPSRNTRGVGDAVPNAGRDSRARTANRAAARSGGNSGLSVGADSQPSPLMKCTGCHGSGTIRPEAEMVERMRGWRVEEYPGSAPVDSQRPNDWWQIANSGDPFSVFRIQAEAERELRRRDLAQFADCGRTVECDQCREVSSTPCGACQDSGTRLVKPVEFLGSPALAQEPHDQPYTAATILESMFQPPG